MILRLLTVTLLFAATGAHADESTEADSLIVGTWQSVDHSGTTQYRSVYRNKFQRLKMVSCHTSRDISGTETDIVVCDDSSRAAKYLRHEGENRFAVHESGLTSVSADGSTLTESGLFGLYSSVWTKSDADVKFVFVKMKGY